jgi:hypothetical protein
VRGESEGEVGWVSYILLTCCAIILLISGSQCPRALTAIPAVKSRYFLFSTSQRYMPSPFTNIGGGRT